MPRRWQFVGATYNGRTGRAKLFVNRRFTGSKFIGRIRLATNYPARMGARIGDRRYFRGRISCMQVYDTALTTRQILRRKRRCFRKGMGMQTNISMLKLAFTDSHDGSFTQTSTDNAIISDILFLHTASLKSRCFLFIFIILVSFILVFRLVRKLVFSILQCKCIPEGNTVFK